jgi:hypothetical protein
MLLLPAAPAYASEIVYNIYSSPKASPRKIKMQYLLRWTPIPPSGRGPKVSQSLTHLFGSVSFDGRGIYDELGANYHDRSGK